LSTTHVPDESSPDGNNLEPADHWCQAGWRLGLGEDGGKAFIAMEFLNGMTLKHGIGGKPVDTDILLGLAI
jgi:hypothetical protein